MGYLVSNDVKIDFLPTDKVRGIGYYSEYIDFKKIKKTNKSNIKYVL